MLRIGEFARLGQVPITTLRHYDRVCLLVPTEIDPDSSYRYYSVKQLPRLHRILALKALGLALEQIKAILEDEITAEELQGMLRLRKADMLHQLQDIEASLEQVEARLSHIRKEGKMPEYEVVLKSTEPQLVASKRITIPSNDEVPNYLTPAFDEVFGYITANGAKKAGPGIARWHTPFEAQENEEVEAIFPIDKEIKQENGIRIYSLPVEEVAAVVHDGDFEFFMDGYAAVLKWIEENGYQVDGTFREVYHHFEPDNLKETTTEIQFPAKKA